MKRTLTCLCLLLALCLAGPAGATAQAQLPAELAMRIEAARRPFITPADAEKVALVEARLTPDAANEADLRVADILAQNTGLVRDAQTPRTVTADEALTDAAFLFDYLRCGYAGYGQMGGDAAFLPVQEQVEADIRAFSGELTPEAFEALLVRRLQTVIRDSHFTLGDTNFASSVSQTIYYSNDALFFDAQADGGFITQMEGRAWRLVSVNGGDPKAMLRLTLDPDGRLCYALGMNTGESEDLPKELTVLYVLSDGDRTQEREATLSINYRSYMGWPVYNRYERDGITILENRSLYPQDEAEKEALARFTQDALSLSREDIIILDIRGNSGGSDEYPSNWVRNFTRLAYQPWNHVFASTLDTHTSNLVRLLGLVQGYDLRDEEALKSCLETGFASLLRMQMGTLSGWTPVEYEPVVERIPSDPWVFVLTDQGVASSGETFVNLLSRMENVVFVGNGTCGMYTVANNRTVALPASGLSLYCGDTLFLPPDLQDIEGRGFAPDIWVTPDGSDTIIERIVKFVDRYGLRGGAGR